ncbi:helix-turn-helix domain-containing protein [Paeniglutamicibacter psychrophenolicus]|uniref:helix-turn-helix domain-containing protein n=1 Tax=Paeniglutamicibacter psychrophenolicus TaxID=257454 RepID=UPI0027886E5C|nr:helix-turn-helix domain-containing protein [Paeniglutamicibacter psychrophenolicus]MDQ0092464.1 hypothetical protein [Paeniglutamicibacter psychrophenolicus]
MDLYTTVMASEELGVTPAAVRRLVDSGRLQATKLAGALLFEPASIHRLQRCSRSPGRIWSPRTAWAALEILHNQQTELIDQPRRSRLTRQLRSLEAAELHRLARNHSQLRRFRGGSRVRSSLAGKLLPTGVSSIAQDTIADRFGLAGAFEEDRLEGYWVGSIESLLDRIPMALDEVGGVLVRFVDDHELISGAVGSDAVIALDLMDSDDIRERGAGRDALQRMIANA